MRKIIITVVAAVLLISACVKPPKDAEPVNLLALIEEILLEANKVRDDASGREEFAEQGRQLETLIAFYEGSKIVFKARKSEPQETDIVCTNGHNELLILKDVYATMGPKDTLAFSLNGRDWFFSQNDSEKDINHVATDYQFNPDFDERRNVLTVGFKGTMRIADGAEPFQLNDPRETMELSSGMILHDSNNKRKSVDMKRSVLFIEEGTTIHVDMSLDGNIVKSRNYPDRLVFSAVKDLFVYRKANNRAGLSFDNRDWSISPFAFKINRESTIISTGTKSIYADFTGEVSYKGK